MEKCLYFVLNHMDLKRVLLPNMLPNILRYIKIEMKHRRFSWDIRWYICVPSDIPRKVSVFHFNLNWKDQEGVLLFEVRFFQHDVLFSFDGWRLVKW